LLTEKKGETKKRKCWPKKKPGRWGKKQSLHGGGEKTALSFCLEQKKKKSPTRRPGSRKRKKKKELEKKGGKKEPRSVDGSPPPPKRRRAALSWIPKKKGGSRSKRNRRGDRNHRPLGKKKKDSWLLWKGKEKGLRGGKRDHVSGAGKGEESPSMERGGKKRKKEGKGILSWGRKGERKESLRREKKKGGRKIRGKERRTLRPKASEKGKKKN